MWHIYAILCFIASILPWAGSLGHGMTSGMYVRQDTCPANIQFELGSLLHWETNTGRVTANPGLQMTWDRAVWLKDAGLPLRHELRDRNQSGPLDYWGGFPLNPPFGGGRYAVRLGSDRNDPTNADSVPNALSEGIRYAVKVPANAENFGIIFSYAVVFENPNHPANLHTYDQQPRFIARMYVPGGDTLKCANFTFVASDPLPGFSVSDKVKLDSATGRYPGGVNFAPVKYKPWSSVFVNLNRYAGQTLYLEFITADCTKRGHFGYAYVDVLECIIPVNASLSCDVPQQIRLTAPPGFKGYQWWNRDFSRLLGTGDTLSMPSMLKENDTVKLRVLPYDSYGCEDTLKAIVKMPFKPVAGIRYPIVQTLKNLNTPLSARNIGKAYLWQPSIGLDNPGIRNPVFRLDLDREYLIRIVNQNDCPTVDTQFVRVLSGVGLHVPDAFSPNGDGKNDLLLPYVGGMKELRFWVFNRWGQLMYETRTPIQGWDGRFKGIPQPVETYVWIAEGIALDGSEVRRRGQTILIR